MKNEEWRGTVGCGSPFSILFINTRSSFLKKKSPPENRGAFFYD
jgi:hypothetical protein